ncbi:MAG: thioredoxin domain-containing protein [Betaproteobacteria bacterium]|nr:thioredoxin domain-containing protein [Betaproteobacteria bacterium]
MSNRLARETSPYLLQHADNPVDWHPWGEEALTLARREDRPILLSIGYSACHWCHVMAHESFEDAGVAATMNRLFVNIKVDREERPDLDQIYQSAHQLLARRPGGWPLTMFLTPDGVPFYGGTYFPRVPRHGLPGFGDLLERVAEVYRDRRADVQAQAEDVRGALARDEPGSAGRRQPFTTAPLEAFVDTLAGSFDERHGGFGGAPKFPHPANLMLLLRRHAATGDERARHMALLTLARMAEGGIHDQIGGGFCRYSVDASWNIPHFEKMLYDNGPLLRLYAEAWALSGDEVFRAAAAGIAAWTMREMQSAEGGYYAALDADSEHEEGRFYVWTPGQAQQVLTSQEYAVAARHFGLAGAANFERHAWHLYVARPLDEVARELGLARDEAMRLLAGARDKLLAERERRVHPGRDDKILTGWNALMIEGMARAASVFGRRDWLDSARRALDFVRATLWRDGRLLATFKDGRAHLNAYLDDHAFLLLALLELLQADFRTADLEFAEDLADLLLDRFEDREGGGFYFTSHDHERLIQRPRTGHDGATPAGNGVAALALQRLGHITGEVRYLDAAERTLQAFLPQMARQPAGFATLLMALEEALQPPRTVVLSGPAGQAREWHRRLLAGFRPQTMVLHPGEAAGSLPPTLETPPAEEVNARLCTGVTCLAPTRDWTELERMVNAPGLR